MLLFFFWNSSPFLSHLHHQTVVLLIFESFILFIIHAVLVKRFAFKDSLDASVITLHEEIKKGAIKVTDGMLSAKAMDILRKC